MRAEDLMTDTKYIIEGYPNPVVLMPYMKRGCLVFYDDVNFYVDGSDKVIREATKADKKVKPPKRNLFAQKLKQSSLIHFKHQAHMADELGLHKTTIGNWIQGTKPGFGEDAFNIIADYYNVPPCELVRWVYTEVD